MFIESWYGTVLSHFYSCESLTHEHHAVTSGGAGEAGIRRLGSKPGVGPPISTFNPGVCGSAARRPPTCRGPSNGASLSRSTAACCCASCCPAYGSTISSSFPSRRPFARYALLIRRPVCRQNHTHHRPRRCSVLKNHVHPPPRFPLLRRRSRSCGVRGGVTHRAHVARTQASGERRAPGEAQDRVFSPVRQEAVVVAILVH